MKRLFTLILLFFLNFTFSKDIGCNDKKKIYKICSNQYERFLDFERKAKRKSEIILIKFGADWCPWCRSLHKTFSTKEFKQKFRNLAYYKVGTHHYAKSEKMPDAKKILNYIRGTKVIKPKGIPYLIIYSPLTKKFSYQDTGPLEKNTKKKKGHDEKKVYKAISKSISLI